MDPWSELDKIDADLKSPAQIIEELFSGISNYTNNAVSFKLHKVYFFPEEVTYSRTTSFKLGASILDDFVPKQNPHPEFGYNPEQSANEQQFRFRILLYNVENEAVEYELFKVKFPILFYPVEFYIEPDDFEDLKVHFSENKLIAENEKKLIEIVTTIIKSKEHLLLLKRVMAI